MGATGTERYSRNMDSLRDLFAAIGAALDERDARLLKRIDALEAKIAFSCTPPAPPMPKRYLTIGEAAQMIHMSPQWLRKAARQSDGPPRIQAGKCIRYDTAQLMAWFSRGHKS
jgi:hypothetical protein